MNPESFGSRVKRTTMKIIKVIIISLIVVGAGGFAILYWGVNADEQRSGTVLRIGKRGMLFKTYEGQLNLHTLGSLKRTTPFMEAFDFSVESDDDQVIKDLQEVALSGEYVSLHYVQRYAKFPWRGDTRIFVTKVERSNRATPPSAPQPPLEP
jgi:hypothetical protein